MFVERILGVWPDADHAHQIAGGAIFGRADAFVDIDGRQAVTARKIEEYQGAAEIAEQVHRNTRVQAAPSEREAGGADSEHKV